MPPHNPAADRGASAVEYVGLVMLVAAIVFVATAAVLPSRIGETISNSIACVFADVLPGGGGECDSSGESLASDDEADDDTPEPDSNPAPNPEPSDDMVVRPADLAGGAQDGAADAACLTLMCGPDEAGETWADVGDTAANVDPAVWDEEGNAPQLDQVFFDFGSDDEGGAPDPDTPPDEVNDWWEGLSETEREEVMRDDPDSLRNLDGIPAEVRDDLNREFLGDEIERRLEEEEMSREDALNVDNDDSDDMVELRELVNLEETLNADGEDDPDVVDGDEYFMLSLDPDEGRSAVSRGNPDTADNVSTMVPGTGITWEAVNGQLGRADSVHDAASAQNGDDHASIAWIGYDTPSAVEVAFSDSKAEEGQEELIDFQNGLRETHEGEPSNNTIIGHSFGSTMVGLAAQTQLGDPHDPLAADNLIFTGSPGVRGSSASDLDIDPDNVHATRSADDDVVGDFIARRFGANVTGDDYGANQFTTDPGTDHTQYFDDHESTQMEYMGAVVAGEAPEE